MAQQIDAAYVAMLEARVKAAEAKAAEAEAKAQAAPLTISHVAGLTKAGHPFDGVNVRKGQTDAYFSLGLAKAIVSDASFLTRLAAAIAAPPKVKGAK